MQLYLWTAVVTTKHDNVMSCHFKVREILCLNVEKSEVEADVELFDPRYRRGMQPHLSEIGSRAELRWNSKRLVTRGMDGN